MTQISHLAVALTLIAFGLFVWRGNPRSKTNKRFALKILLLALWAVGTAGLQSGLHLDIWGRFVFLIASFIPVAVLSAIHELPSDNRGIPRAFQRLIFVLACVFAVASTTTTLVVYDIQIVGGELVRRTGPLYSPFAVYFVAVWCIVLAVLFSKWRRARGLARAQLQYLGAGIVIGAAGGISVNLLLPLATGRSTYSWIGPYFSLVFVAWTTHAIIPSAPPRSPPMRARSSIRKPSS